MLITLDASQDDILLLNSDAKRNMWYISVTLGTCQEDELLLNPNTERNIYYTYVTTNPDIECYCRRKWW